MKIDLHNHTTLCNHAEGSMPEYIEQALAMQTQIFGFSDHAPMDFDPKYRMRFDQMHAYESQVKALKTQYASTIEILLGYEVDFLEGHMDKRVLEADVDYLIGSVHFLDKWGFDNPEFLNGYNERDIDEIWEHYFLLIAKMAQSGLFDIVGHIDLIKVFKFLPKKKSPLEYAIVALEAIKKADMTLELNAAGYAKPCQEPYPSKEILKKAYELGIPITFGSDAHKPQRVGLYGDKLLSLAKEVGYDKCAYYRNRKRAFLPI